MPTVTVSQPPALRVKVSGAQSRVREIGVTNINLPQKIGDAPDVNLASSNTGDVLTYDANTQVVTAKPLNANTNIGGSLVPNTNEAYDLGAPELKWKSLYLSGNTLVLGNVVLTAEQQSGSLIIGTVSDPNNPLPSGYGNKGLMITQNAGIVPIETNGVGKPLEGANYLQQALQTPTYENFSGNIDSGFF